MTENIKSLLDGKLSLLTEQERMELVDRLVKVYREVHPRDIHPGTAFYLAVGGSGKGPFEGRRP